LDRRDFLKLLSAAGAAGTLTGTGELFALPRSSGAYRVGRIVNEYSAFLPGEKAALAEPPSVSDIDQKGATASHTAASQRVAHGGNIAGWVLLTTLEINGVMTAVFEKHATHRGAIAYVTERGGTIALIPKQVGDLSKVRPRPTDTSHGVKLKRPLRMPQGPDATGDYILKSTEDPCYENVAALGAEFIGWTLVRSTWRQMARADSRRRILRRSGRPISKDDSLIQPITSRLPRRSGTPTSMATASAHCWAAICRWLISRSGILSMTPVTR